MSAAAVKRRFFALPLPDSLQASLSGSALLGPDLPGRPVAAENLHLTLVFLGNTTAQQAGVLQEAAAAISVDPFELSLDRLGWWRRSGVLWLAPSRVPAALPELVQQLRLSARKIGLAVDERNYRPHLTLRRHVDRAVALPVPRLPSWPVRAFSLAVSTLHSTGPVYSYSAQWTLVE